MTRSLLAGVLVAIACGGARAQTCPDLLAAAEERYAAQVYVDVAPLVRDCLSRETLPAAETQRAYRLLALAYLKQGMSTEARLAVVELLGENPSYRADPRIDLPPYVAVVDAAREQLRTVSDVLTPAPAPPAAQPPPVAQAPAAQPPAAPTAPEPSATALVDVNTAGAEALDAVPGIGPALAARIIAHREQHGAFRSVAELEAVRGIGPRSIEQMRPYLTAGGSLTASGAAGAAAPAPAASGQPINLNTATAAELETLPGIGPALAGRIVEFRASFGPFRDLRDVLLVRGIGARKLEAIAPLVTVR